MAKKKDKEPRILTCQKTGVKFTYTGVGRPPKYCEAVREEIRKAQRNASVKRRRETKKAERAIAAAAAISPA